MANSLTATARHILVESEQECNDLINQLKEGASFDTLAAEHSKCPSGKSGGNLGSFQQGQMVPEFDKVVFEAPVGLYGEPVKTDFGYHVIDVVSREEG
jgi:peptidyl-prolyl cis-trans isomerase C